MTEQAWTGMTRFDQETGSSEEVNDYAESRRYMPKIPVWEHTTLARHLATEDMTRSQLAKHYGVGRPAITLWAKAHAQLIDEIKADLDNEFAGIWAANKEKRIAALTADVEASLAHPKADHFEWARQRQQSLRAIAEETGQLDRSLSVNATVMYQLVGVDPNEILPANEPAAIEGANVYDEVDDE